MEKCNVLRSVYFTDEFNLFYASLNDSTKKKIDYILLLIKEHYLIHTDFVKKLTNTNLYEMRVKVSIDEYRVIVFSIDHQNIIESTEVILLTGFLKKSTKDYEKQIRLSGKILNKLEL